MQKEYLTVCCQTSLSLSKMSRLIVSLFFAVCLCAAFTSAARILGHFQDIAEEALFKRNQAKSSLEDDGKNRCRKQILVLLKLVTFVYTTFSRWLANSITNGAKCDAGYIYFSVTHVLTENTNLC